MKRRLNKIKEFISTTKPSPITQGNSYEIHNQLNTQTEIDLNTAGLSTSGQLTNTVESALAQINKEKIEDKIFNEYVLLHLQGNYFCGTCEFDVKDAFLKRIIMLVIRGAWLYGTAGVYIDEFKNVRPVYITGIDYDITGKMSSCKIYSLDLMITNMNKTQSQMNNEDLTLQTLSKEQCERLAVFQWGTMGFSAWITVFPFCKLQYGLLKMIITQTYIYMKKLGYRTENKETILDEIKLFFNENNPFIISSNLSKDISNRFVVEGMSADFTGSDFIEYYEKTIYAFYHLLGRRINNDVKKERNVSSEVEATQENYNIIQNDYLHYFDIFVKDLNKLIPNANVENLAMRKEEPKENEDEHIKRSDNSRDNSKDN